MSQVMTMKGNDGSYNVLLLSILMKQMILKGNGTQTNDEVYRTFARPFQAEIGHIPGQADDHTGNLENAEAFLRRYH